MPRRRKSEKTDKQLLEELVAKVGEIEKDQDLRFENTDLTKVLKSFFELLLDNEKKKL